MQKIRTGNNAFLGMNPVPHFGTILDQQRPILLLTTLLKKGHIPHALLFTGIDGVGKKTVGITFAMACHCDDSPLKKGTSLTSNIDSSLDDKVSFNHDAFPCCHCKSCERIASDRHPDVIQVQSDGTVIRIHQIRKLTETLSMKPFEEGLRIVILSDAHHMNPEAANAFLKTLEEPPDRTILILTAPQTSALLPTIVSRCETILFSPLSQKSVMTLLMTKENIPPETATLLGALSDGSLSKAIRMHNTHWIEKRNMIVKELDFFNTNAALSIPSLFALAEFGSKDKEGVDDFLEILISILRDIAIAPFHKRQILNEDLSDDIVKMSKQISVDDILRRINVIERCRSVIKRNVNPRLSMEVMLLQMLDVIRDER